MYNKVEISGYDMVESGVKMGFPPSHRFPET